MISVISGDETFVEEPIENDPRLAYFTNTAEGLSYATFNGTSMQNLVVLGVILVVLGSLLLPYYGITNGILGLFDDEPNTEKNDFNMNESLFSGNNFAPYQGIIRRSEDEVEPIWKAIMNYQQKYAS